MAAEEEANRRAREAGSGRAGAVMAPTFGPCSKCKRTFDAALGPNWIDDGTGCPLCRVRLDQQTVDHPPHYSANGVEAMDVIEAFGLGFHLGNVVKYVLRADRKGVALVDLQKARWYLDREIQRRGAPP